SRDGPASPRIGRPPVRSREGAGQAGRDPGRRDLGARASSRCLDGAPVDGSRRDAGGDARSRARAGRPAARAAGGDRRDRRRMGAASLRTPHAHDPAGGARGDPPERGQSAGAGASAPDRPRAHAPAAPGRGGARGRGGAQSDALRRGARLRPHPHGGAHRGGQGPRPRGAADPRARARRRGADRGGSAARAAPVPHRSRRPRDPGRALRGGRRGARLGLSPRPPPRRRLGGRVVKLLSSETLLALALFWVLALMAIPLPAPLLDVLLAISFTLSLLVLLVAVYAERPLDFSVFPSLLLLVTLLRLGLNVASTRLILMHGAQGSHAAGHVIQAFGEFAVGGSFVVGFVIFSIFLIINFVVITKGAGRIAEVAARFTLDALPGKQMAVDADLNHGVIDEAQARARRAELQREADFYGAMDGASKFVRGDAVAGLLILAANVVGGIAIGVLQEGMPI